MNLEYRIIGQGPETIVVETGLGNTFYDWLAIAAQMSKSCRVVLYHRSGYGNSPISDLNRSTINIASELNELMVDLDINAFYLIGHSFGGLCAQEYLIHFPEKIKGVLLLDATSPRLMEMEALETPFLNKHCSTQAMIEMNLGFSRAPEEDLIKMFHSSLKKKENELSDADFKAYKKTVLSPSYNSTIANELSKWGESGDDLKVKRKTFDLPIWIISRDKDQSIENYIKAGVPKDEAIISETHWRSLQEDLREYSSKSHFLVADGCDHMIHLEDPEFLVDIIKRMIKE